VEKKIRIRDKHPRSLFREFRNNFLGLKTDTDLDPGYGMEKSISGIRHKQPGSATLNEFLPDVKIPHGVLGLVLGRRALSHFLSEILDLCIPAKLPQPSVSVR
jgi:hypothetical protein